MIGSKASIGVACFQDAPGLEDPFAGQSSSRVCGRHQEKGISGSLPLIYLNGSPDLHRPFSKTSLRVKETKSAFSLPWCIGDANV